MQIREINGKEQAAKDIRRSKPVDQIRDMDAALKEADAMEAQAQALAQEAHALTLAAAKVRTAISSAGGPLAHLKALIEGEDSPKDDPKEIMP